MQSYANLTSADHAIHMRHALTLATQSPPRPTNFRVGALLFCPSDNTVLATGYTLELPGNTHAEQCCFDKFASTSTAFASIPDGSVLYTTMEPCVDRKSGELGCVWRILRECSIDGNSSSDYKQVSENTNKSVPKIAMVVCGVKEPETFIGQNHGPKILQDAGIQVVYFSELEQEILAIATAGHV